MPTGPLGGPRLMAIGPFVEDESIYYHAAPESVTPEIEERGLKAGGADECPSGEGIHVFDKKRRAVLWAEIKSGGGYSEPEPYRIWQVTPPENRQIVSDSFEGIDFPGAYVVCGSGSIGSDLVYKTDTVVDEDVDTSW